MKTPGQAAYEKFLELCQPYVPEDAVFNVQWAQLSDLGRAGWEQVAAAAINQHIDMKDAREQAYEPPTY